MRQMNVLFIAMSLGAVSACVTVNREIVVDRGGASPASEAEVYDEPQQPPPPDQTEPPPSVAEGAFDEPLSPYGEWDYSGRYGRVWIPYREVVGRNWRPYTYGHWARTEYGWTWVSDFSWGWAPFHYGRWAWDGDWVWVPGTTWGPAWVYWRTGPSYLGWAAMPPGAAVGSAIVVAAGTWIFIESADFLEHRLYQHIIYGSRVRNIYGYTTVYDSYGTYHSHRYYAGPRHDYVSRHTHRVARYRPARSLDRPNRPVYRPPSGRSGHHGSQRGSSSAHAGQLPARGSGHGRSAHDGSRSGGEHGSTGQDGRNHSGTDRDDDSEDHGYSKSREGDAASRGDSGQGDYRRSRPYRLAPDEQSRESRETEPPPDNYERGRTYRPERRPSYPTRPEADKGQPDAAPYRPKPAPRYDSRPEPPPERSPAPRRSAPPKTVKPDSPRSSPPPRRSPPPRYTPQPRRSPPPARSKPSKPSSGSSKKTKKKKSPPKKVTPHKRGR